MKETHYRSIIKAISYRLLGSAVTFLIALAFTRKIESAAGIGVADTILKIGAFYFHERLWNYIHFGKRPPADYQI